MATIVSLPARRPGRSGPSANEGEATILLFTGVRYVREDAEERDVDVDPAALRPAAALCDTVTAAVSAACAMN